jgi:DNA repair photolyase
VSRIEWIEARSALTETGGFLGDASSGFTHSFSPAIGCLLGRTSCGVFCYAQFLQSHRTRGAGAWGDYLLVKRNAAEVLREELERAARRPLSHRHHVSRIRVFSASSTEPLVGPCLPIYRECLRVVADYPVAAWVIQTRSPLVRTLEREISALAGRAVVSMTIESDDDGLASLGLPGTPTIRARMRAVESMASWPVPVHVAVSPAMPIGDVERFADWIAEHADLATIDTFTEGDGTRDGSRTGRTRLPGLLAARGVDWRLDTRAVSLFESLRARMGDRVGWSRAGFRRLASATSVKRTM